MIDINKYQESSLSRLKSKMDEHDCGVVTAYRYAEYDENNTITHLYTNSKLNKVGKTIHLGDK